MSIFKRRAEAPAVEPSKPKASPDSADVVIAYHERSKHYPHRYASSLGYMDWDTQPDPFRVFDGAPTTSLPRSWSDPGPRFDDSVAGRAEPTAMNLVNLSRLFHGSLAISAWKGYSDVRWALRCNPSSGNLHPTEGYLIARGIEGLCDAAALFHYRPIDHALEKRLEFDTSGVPWPEDTVLVGLTSIHWRESWKYGERAFRYCQHDVGHAIAAVAYAASALGWTARVIDRVADAVLARLLGVEGQTGPEAEHPDTLVAVTRDDRPFDAMLLNALVPGPAAGSPNALSAEHHDWPAIDAVAEASRRVTTGGNDSPVRIEENAIAIARPHRAFDLFRQRRSAVDMDGRTAIDAAAFHVMMDRLLPRAGAPPFSARPHAARIHPVLFIHRVIGVDPGLYILVRDDERLDELRAAMRAEFEWTTVPETPAPLSSRLLLLRSGDLRGHAAGIACQQAIAGDGAFAVAMIADFERPIRERGAWFYRRLHWEAGMIGQSLYLEAEAAGIRGTGIGCFFDDAMHELLGLRDRRFQTIYHFTVGGPIEDDRLRTESAYPPEK